LESRQDLLGCIAGGWGTSLIVSAQTGVPINIVESADCCLCDMPTSAQHPDFLGGQITFSDPRSATAVAGRSNSCLAIDRDGAGNPYFRVGTGNSATLGAGRLGTFGRNVFHGPAYVNWDIDAFKRVAIWGI